MKLNGLYWREWGLVVKRLKLQPTYSQAGAESLRHAYHRKALGTDKSSKDLTGEDLNKILKVFRAASGNFLDTLTNEQKQRLWVIRDLCRQLGKPSGYAQAIVDHMQREGRLESGPNPKMSPAEKWEQELDRETTPRRKILEELSADEMTKIIIALRLHASRTEAASVESSGDPF